MRSEKVHIRAFEHGRSAFVAFSLARLLRIERKNPGSVETWGIVVQFSFSSVYSQFLVRFF